jgi:hypothetical protein
MGRQARDFTAASDLAATRIRTAADDLRQRGEELGLHSDTAVQRLARLGFSLTQRSKETQAAADGNAERLERLRKLLESQGNEAQRQTAELAVQTVAAQEALEKRLRDLETVQARARDGLDKLGETLDQRARNVADVADLASARVRAWDKNIEDRTRELARATDDVLAKGREVAEAVESQTRGLKRAVAEAGDIRKALEEEGRRVSVDDFLRRATFISERLQSLAVDMSRVLETPITEDDWKRYQSGESGVFVRKMLGFREKPRLAAIAQRYSQDSEFRDYVNRYLADFEGLVKEARQRDHRNVLSTTFLSSDIGKLYLLLGRALGREI